MNITKWEEYMVQEGLLFKNIQLIIPICSMWENFIKENVVEDYEIILVIIKI